MNRSTETTRDVDTVIVDMVGKSTMTVKRSTTKKAAATTWRHRRRRQFRVEKWVLDIHKYIIKSLLALPTEPDIEHNSASSQFCQNAAAVDSHQSAYMPCFLWISGRSFLIWLFSFNIFCRSMEVEFYFYEHNCFTVLVTEIFANIAIIAVCACS